MTAPALEDAAIDSVQAASRTLAVANDKYSGLFAEDTIERADGLAEMMSVSDDEALQSLKAFGPRLVDDLLCYSIKLARSGMTEHADKAARHAIKIRSHIMDAEIAEFM